MKFKWIAGHRNTLVSVLIVTQLWKLIRLLKKCPHWYISAKGCWTTAPPTVLLDFFGSPDILEYVEMKLLISPQGRALLISLLDQSQLYGSWSGISGGRLGAGLAVSTWWCVKVISACRDARKLILGPCLAARTGLLPCNRVQSRVVAGLLTGHNSLRSHLYVMGLTHSRFCRRCVAEDETCNSCAV